MRRRSQSSKPDQKGADLAHTSVSRLRPFDYEEAEEAFGNEVWSFLETVMTLLWEPEQMNEKLIVLGTRFFKVNPNPQPEAEEPEAH